jgi:hypothetical protein
MQLVQLKLINDQILEFKTVNDHFSKEIQDCYQNDSMLKIRLEDENNDEVFINPNHILYAKFKDI